MTIDEVIAEIKRGLGYRQDKTDEIKAKLYLAQQELERGTTLPHFIVLYDETISLSADTAEWTLPSNFIRELDDFADPNASAVNGDRVALVKKPYDWAASIYSGRTGAPVVYARRNNSLTFFPTTDEDVELTISYYARQDDPRTAGSNAWSENAPLLLIGLAGMMVAADLHDQRAEAKFATQYALAKKSIFHETVASEDANQSYSLGGAL